METIQLEWLNQNSLRAYPIREDCSRIPCDSAGNPTDASLALPNCVITDFVLVVDNTLSKDIYISRVAYLGSYLNISISSGLETIATVAVDISQHTPNKVYRFFCSGTYEASEGAITIGDLTYLPDLLPAGQYSYTLSQTAFEATCIRPSISAVTGISVYDSTTGYKSLPLHGDVKLIAGSNIEFEYDSDSNEITINAGDGLGYTEDCVCKDYSTKIERINGVTAADVELVGSECINITANTDTGVIRITDTCAKPCCGCTELAFINDKISEIQTAVGRLSAYSDQLREAIVAFNAMTALANALN